MRGGLATAEVHTPPRVGAVCSSPTRWFVGLGADARTVLLDARLSAHADPCPARVRRHCAHEVAFCVLTGLAERFDRADRRRPARLALALRLALPVDGAVRVALQCDLGRLRPRLRRRGYDPGAVVRIEPWGEHDLPLLERLLCDPAMMEHLGGPESRKKVAARHARYLAGADRDPQFRVVDAGRGEPAGWVGYSERDWRDEPIYEIGWSVFPEHQGRGIATAAAGLAIAHAREKRGRRFVHAFPSVGNPPSNAICRKAGFAFVEPCVVEFPPGTRMRCNDWRLDLLERAA